jgi:hypothetical protein
LDRQSDKGSDIDRGHESDSKIVENDFYQLWRSIKVQNYGVDDEDKGSQ